MGFSGSTASACSIAAPPSHGDDGAGLGASHQTGWTGLVARLVQLLGHLDAETLLAEGGRLLATPYRRLVDEPMGDTSTARRARGVRSP